MFSHKTLCAPYRSIEYGTLGYCATLEYSTYTAHAYKDAHTQREKGRAKTETPRYASTFRKRPKMGKKHRNFHGKNGGDIEKNI